MKVAVVTGATGGLGKEIAIYLAKDGYTVVVHYNKSRAEAEKVLGQIKADSRDSFTISADLTKEEEVEKCFRTILSKTKGVDLLVNNVGDFVYKKFGETSSAEIRDVIETNVFATLYCSRAVLAAMRKQKEGVIINIGSVGCERITIREKSTPYFMGKNGVYVLTKVMAWEEAKNGIRVNMISPGSLAYDIFKRGDFPMGRSARFRDILSALAFLLSEDSYYINGANIEVSGAIVPGID